eukprot:4456348-Pleurochrysis_carterae.AAC.2
MTAPSAFILHRRAPGTDRSAADMRLRTNSPDVNTQNVNCSPNKAELSGLLKEVKWTGLLKEETEC